jgi:transposase
MVLNTIQSIQGPKDKGNFECIWRIRSHQQPDVDSWLQKENRKTVFRLYQKGSQKYDDSIKQIFLIPDNMSIHKSNKVKETLARCHPRMHPVFLPTKSPELNLIEVRWLWMHRQAINNSAFLNEQDMGKAAYDWTCDYNKKHAGKTSTISLQKGSIHVFT